MGEVSGQSDSQAKFIPSISCPSSHVLSFSGMPPSLSAAVTASNGALQFVRLTVGLATQQGTEGCLHSASHCEDKKLTSGILFFQVMTPFKNLPGLMLLSDLM